MTDRELLKLAAKAAGIDIKPMEINNRLIAFMAPNKQCQRGLFNPLEDDGDALRLAVKLGMMVDVRYTDQKAQQFNKVTYWTTPAPGEYVNFEEGLDIYAATRRAIVRAAAEIGGKL